MRLENLLEKGRMRLENTWDIFGGHKYLPNCGRGIFGGHQSWSRYLWVEVIEGCEVSLGRGIFGYLWVEVSLGVGYLWVGRVNCYLIVEMGKFTYLWGTCDSPPCGSSREKH